MIHDETRYIKVHLQKVLMLEIISDIFKYET